MTEISNLNPGCGCLLEFLPLNSAYSSSDTRLTMQGPGIGDGYVGSHQSTGYLTATTNFKHQIRLQKGENHKIIFIMHSHIDISYFVTYSIQQLHMHMILGRSRRCHLREGYSKEVVSLNHPPVFASLLEYSR